MIAGNQFLKITGEEHHSRNSFSLSFNFITTFPQEYNGVYTVCVLTASNEFSSFFSELITVIAQSLGCNNLVFVYGNERIAYIERPILMLT